MTDLGAMNGTLSIARGINNAGQVVGLAIVGGIGTGFLYNGSTMVNLNVLIGIPCNGCAINNNGQIVGQCFPSGSSYGSGFTYNGTLTLVGNYYGSIAQAVNSSGWVTVNPAASTSHAFIYNHGAVTDLGTLWSSVSFAEGINDNGEVVGMSYVAVDNPHAFLYSEGRMSDLNTLAVPGSGLTLTYGYAINAKGQIVGTAVNSLGNVRAFLATPYRKLFLERSGSNMALSWFTNAPTALSLFETTNIVSGNWLPVTNAPLISNSQYQVLLPLTVAGTHFFRLQSQ
jgi:probable HAF family extracellular repeat protein